MGNGDLCAVAASFTFQLDYANRTPVANSASKAPKRPASDDIDNDDTEYQAMLAQ